MEEMSALQTPTPKKRCRSVVMARKAKAVAAHRFDLRWPLSKDVIGRACALFLQQPRCNMQLMGSLRKGLEV
jgi:hypothetical protein